MTEAAWLACIDPTTMLEVLRGKLHFPRFPALGSPAGAASRHELSVARLKKAIVDHNSSTWANRTMQPASSSGSPGHGR